MLWFGKHWGAPVNDENWHAPVPQGRECMHCKNLIEQSDAGFILNNVDRNGAVTSAVVHADCLFVRLGTPPRSKDS